MGTPARTSNRGEHLPMKKRILFVDDDVNLLASYRRQFGRRYEVQVAAGGDDGLALLKKGSCALVVSDMRMPGMNGIEFLTRARKVSPDTVRIMLTGAADLTTAVNAVNQGNIFRFLSKPCSRDTIEAAIQAGLEQYRLITAERELLERTLRGSVWTLVEILGLVNPTLFSRATRLRAYARRVLKEIKVSQSWRYELAAMMCEIGAVTLPPDLLERVEKGAALSPDEQKLYESHARVGADLLGSIPRLEPIADMIQGQLTGTVDIEHRRSEDMDADSVAFGTQLLKTIQRVDALVESGKSLAETLAELEDGATGSNLSVLSALGASIQEQPRLVVRPLDVVDFPVGAIADEDIRSLDGTLLLPKGQEITATVRTRLRNYAAGGGVREPVRVRLDPDARNASPGQDSVSGDAAAA